MGSNYVQDILRGWHHITPSMIKNATEDSYTRISKMVKENAERARQAAGRATTRTTIWHLKDSQGQVKRLNELTIKLQKKNELI